MIPNQNKERGIFLVNYNFLIVPIKSQDKMLLKKNVAILMHLTLEHSEWATMSDK